MAQPIQIHPDKPTLFQFRDKPIVLLCATEHYGAVINRPFDFEAYLADAADKKQTLTRLFVLFREQQAHINPYSTCKPESPDFISPFARTGEGNAFDAQPKYDLTQWNPEFFERLHRFMALSSKYGVIVELTLLSNTYNDSVWLLNPLHADNNVNGLNKIEWWAYNTLRDAKLFEWQAAHVRKIVEETNQYDNLIYEICNEPGGDFPSGDNKVSPKEVNDWQAAIAAVIRETEKDLPNKHIISGQEAFTYEPWEQSSDLSFNEFPIDVVNMHPLPNTTYAGKGYEMGNFMSKQLKLDDVKQYCLSVRNEKKPLNLDEDNVASQYKDIEGWTIHRKRAWTTLLCGAHYDYIDFSIINYLPTGTPMSQKYIRTWFKHLSEFVHSLDLVRVKPAPEWILDKPEHVVDSVLAIEGESYSIYLADGRELGAAGAGTTIEGSIAVQLPEKAYKVSCYDPKTGLYSPSIKIQGSVRTVIELPAFEHDLVVVIKA